MKTKQLTIMALLSTLLAIFGSFKIPGIIPGTEFQLSAPFAVCIAAIFGFKKYLFIGITASIINLIMGTHTILNVVVAMVFRLVAGGLIAIFGNNIFLLAICGPIGTICGRIVLALILKSNMLVLITGAVPGMIFTSIATLIMYPVMQKIMNTQMVN